MIKNKNAKIKFAIGPETEIMPFFILSTRPSMITAPGAKNTKPRNESKNEKNNIPKLALNSAIKPKCLATNL